MCVQQTAFYVAGKLSVPFVCLMLAAAFVHISSKSEKLDFFTETVQELALSSPSIWTARVSTRCDTFHFAAWSWPEQSCLPVHTMHPTLMCMYLTTNTG